MGAGLQVIMDNTESVLSDRDIDRLIFAVQARTTKLFVVEKPMVRKDAAEYLGISLSTFDKIVAAEKIPKHYIDGLDIPFFLPSEMYELIKRS